MSLADRLRALAESLPTDTAAVTLSRADLLTLLDGSEPERRTDSGDGEPLMDLAVTDLMQATGKARSTVIGWIKAGDLESYRFGHEHRITREAWRAFLDHRRSGGRDLVDVRPSRGRAVDLSSWRNAKTATRNG